MTNDETHEDEWLGALEVRAVTGPVDELIGRSGNLHRLIRIAAWVNRFIGNIRARMKRRRDREQSNTEEPTQQPGVGHKQGAEKLRSARLTLLCVAQLADFPDELHHLRRGKQIQRESRLLTLSPFIDACRLLRVGGRLQNSVLEYDARHPIVLDPHHQLSRLLLLWAHHCVNHERADRSLAEIRARYWILRGREAAKSTITNCLVCARDRAGPPQPLMAPLPESRARPFQRPQEHPL